VTVPVVDVGPLRVEGSPAAASAIAAIDAACRETGFFVVVGHGLDDLMEPVFAGARRLFALPEPAKRALTMRRRCGYKDDGAKELFDVGLDDPDNQWPDDRWPELSGFRDDLERYEHAALDVAMLILRALAIALDLPATFFAERMADPECYLRLLRYPAASDGPTPTRTHTDYGAITLLATDGVAGLQVHPIGGPWVDVVAPPGSLVINLGDMLARWTNDRYRSTPHRVVTGASDDRYSVPFFVNPDADLMIECIPTCITPDRPCAYPPVTATEFLQGRIDGTIAVPLPAET